MRAASQDQINDHRRDLLKHEPRPSDDRRPLSDHHRILHVSYLTAYLHTLLQIGAIPGHLCPGIRSTVDRTRESFGLPALGPKESA